MKKSVAAALLVGAVAGFDVSAQQPDACQRLASVVLPNATITSATRVDAGKFTPPGGRRGTPEPYADLGAFCRITTTTTISPAAQSKTEIWLPIERWNHDFQLAPGGFYGGGMSYGRMREILRSGSATAASDSGIEGGLPALIQHPEVLKNVASAPFHAMIEQGKTLISAFYGASPRLTLMDECGGAGSRDALAIVERFPNDLDVAAATGPTNWGRTTGSRRCGCTGPLIRTPPATFPKRKSPQFTAPRSTPATRRMA